MKVYINKEPIMGPWGGGNKSVTLLVSELIDQGHSVVHDLSSDVDVIFCFDPRPNDKGVWFEDFLKHRAKYPDCRIIQRVGDVGSHGKPDLTNLVTQSVQYSDFVVFPSDWARKAIKFEKNNYTIIQNAPLKLFHLGRNYDLVHRDRLRLITHHWSMNDMKGFDMYSKLGRACINKLNVEFTYIGRYSNKFSSEGINLIDPKESHELASEIPRHDIYLTASLAEAGANHVLEALGSGLPILYRQGGGSISEYCSEYGLEYNSFESMLDAIDNISKNYKFYKRRAYSYNRNLEDTIRLYVDIILANES